MRFRVRFRVKFKASFSVGASLQGGAKDAMGWVKAMGKTQPHRKCAMHRKWYDAALQIHTHMCELANARVGCAMIDLASALAPASSIPTPGMTR